MERGDARTVIQQLIDDPDGQRWSSANLDLFASTVLDDLWGNLLTFAPYLRSQRDDLTTDLSSPGYIDAGTGGDLSERLYRIQKITRNSREYRPVDQRELVLESDEVIVGPDYTYTRFGPRIYLLPLERSPDVEIRYSYRPTRWEDLTDDSTEVDWPDGFEAAYLHEIAGRLLLKGAAEDPSGHLEIARDAMHRLQGQIQKWYPGPSTLHTTTTPESFGSVG